MTREIHFRYQPYLLKFEELFPFDVNQAKQGSKNPGALSHFATGTRGFATRKLGVVATLRLKPEDQAHHCDQMNILRDQILNTKIRNGFRFQLGRKREM